MFGVVGLTWAHGLEVLGWYAAPDFASGNLRVLKHQGSSGYDTSFANLAVVEQRSTHAYQGIIVDSTRMNRYVVADGDIVTNVGRTSFMGNMNARSVLDIGAIADGDRGYIATNHCIEPYRAFVAHSYIAHNRGVLTEITVSPPFGSETAITFYQSHASVD